MTWTQITADQPALGRVVHDRMIIPGTLFAADVDDVTVIGSESETGAQYVARWPTGQEYLRPATTATSLGPPEPVRRLLSVR